MFVLEVQLLKIKIQKYILENVYKNCYQNSSVLNGTKDKQMCQAFF